jgi:CDGSH-type Zn-finger protein/uncharacterized Fe-S cluster protein YjdI
MKRKIHDYDAAGITIYFERKRCIHALECVRALPDVFSMTRRRWVDATQAQPQEIAAIVERCPTGALHYRRKDGYADEQVPERNEARLAADGPLYLHGNLEIHTAEEVLQETRVALCRCGASRNKPFCDNSHENIAFQDNSAVRASFAGSQSSSGVLRVLIEPDGACVLEGAFSLTGSDDTTIENCGPRLSLCRCGQSRDKPLCDGAHLKTGFKAV